MKEIVTERRSVLKWSGTAFVGALALSGNLPGLRIAESFAQSAGKMSDKTVDLGEGDIGVLNYAYALEQLEAAFYTQVVKTPYGNMQSADRDILTAIRDHEVAHRDFFKAALKKNAIPALDVDFSNIDFNSRDSVLNTAQTFENLGVGAYNGAGQLLRKEEYLLIAGKIVSVEARHATAIGYLLRGNKQANANNGSDNTTGQGGSSQNAQVGQNGQASQNAQTGQNAASSFGSTVDEKGLDQAITPADVLSKAGPFVKTKISADDIG